MAIAPLSFKITADLSGFNSSMQQVSAQLRGVAERVRGSFQGAAAQTQSAATSASSGIAGLTAKLGGLAAAYAALRSVQTFAQISDQAALATARIQGLTGSTEETTQAQAALFEMSQRLQAGYGDAVASFSRMLPAVKELGGGVAQTTRLTEILLTTAKLSGASASEAASSAIQFAQALGSGRLQGDELRSIMENNQTLARTLAAGLGVSLGELRRLGEEGKLTSEQVGRVLLGQYDTLKAQAANLPSTVGGAWTQVRNAFTQLVTKTEASTGAFTALAGVMTELAGAVVAVASAFGQAGKESDKIGQNRGAISFAQAAALAFTVLADIVGSAVKMIWNNIQGLLGIIEVLSLQLTALGAAMTGDFSGAKASFAAAGAAAQRMADNFTESRDAAIGLWDAVNGRGAATTKYIENMVGAPVKVTGEQPADLEGKPPKSPGETPASRKAAANEMLDDVAAIEKSIEMERKRLGVAIEASNIRSEMDRDRALARIESEQQISKFELDNHTLTAEQYLNLELAFEEQKYQIRRAAVERLLELAKAEGRDPAEVERINQQLLQLELDYQQRKQGIELEVKKASGGKGLEGVMQGTQDAFGKVIDSMLTKGQGFGRAMANVWAQMRANIAKSLGQMVMDMLSASLKQRSMALGEIGRNAAKAASGAYSAMASIPYVGPVLGAAAAAATFAGVMAFGSGMPSAAGGWDIPAGVNPVTQLHEREMVLPAEQADAIRGMAGGGGSAGQPIELRGVSAGEFFIAVRKDLVHALRGARREFAL